MILTFLDAGVLIAATRPAGEAQDRALRLIADPERSFVSSPFLRLEVLPKPHFNGRFSEARFLDSFFATHVEYWQHDLAALVNSAEELAKRHGLSAINATHAATALVTGCAELVTTEGLGKPLYRLDGFGSLRVRWLMA